MILVRSEIVSGNDVGFEEARCQGCCGEGKRHRFFEPDLAAVPMKTRQPSVRGDLLQLPGKGKWPDFSPLDPLQRPVAVVQAGQQNLVTK